MRSLVEFDAEYVVLVRNPNPLENRYYWVAEHGVEWADFLLARTELMWTIDDGLDGVIEVRKVVGDATRVRTGGSSPYGAVTETR